MYTDINMSGKLLSGKYKQALDLVAVLFKDEKRKITNVPYIVHLVGVAHIVNQVTDEEDIVVAALLHDVLEDISENEYSEADMKTDFGDRITEIVKTVTHNEEKYGYSGSRDAYLSQVENGSKEAALVSAADLLYNLTDSIESYEKFPAESKTLFMGERAQIKKKFYNDRYELLAEKLSTKNKIIIDLEPKVEEFNKIHDQHLVK